jgi:hypothetical protein
MYRRTGQEAYPTCVGSGRTSWTIKAQDFDLKAAWPFVIFIGFGLVVRATGAAVLLRPLFPEHAASHGVDEGVHCAGQTLQLFFRDQMQVLPPGVRQERYTMRVFWQWSHHSTAPPSAAVRQFTMACIRRC